MAPGLARKHRDIGTYYGRGIDDPSATIAADLSHIGFHASVRSAHGGWYIDPYYRNDTSRYVSYSGVDLAKSFPFVEHGVVKSDERVAKTSGLSALAPTGDVLRTYRLALITDPGYAAYVGGPGNVTAAKVALINRVSQVYHDDISIQLQLIPNNDLLNLNTWAQAIGPNGPCGAAACFTQSQVTGCSSTTRARFVIGQIIGASNYDIGHLALGQPGGGVANLGVVGRSNKAGGCTGIPTPVGDFYAIDYVAHEMGHQFSGNHPFNGNQLNCSSGNRSAATSVEPGSRLVDHGVRGHLPHRRPAAALRPLLVGAQPPGDLDLHVVEPGGDQRGADRFAAPLRRWQRGADRDLRPRLRAGGHDPAADRRDRRRPVGDAAGRPRRGRQHRHGGHRRDRCDAHAPAR